MPTPTSTAVVLVEVATRRSGAVLSYLLAIPTVHAVRRDLFSIKMDTLAVLASLVTIAPILACHVNLVLLARRQTHWGGQVPLRALLVRRGALLSLQELGASLVLPENPRMVPPGTIFVSEWKWDGS